MRFLLPILFILFGLKDSVKCQSTILEPDDLQLPNAELNDGVLPDWAMECFEIEIQDRIIRYTQKYGELGDWEELYRIPGVTKDEIICLYQKYGSFSMSEYAKSDRSLIVRIRHDIRPKEGRNEYGADQYGRIRYKNSFTDDCFFQWEHDRQEWNVKEQSFPDYFSGYFQKRFSRKKWEILIGDYRISYGQGLVAYAGLFASPGAGIQGMVRGSTGYVGNRSKTESGFYRGLVLQRRISKKGEWKGLIWLSNSPLNATLRKSQDERVIWQSLDLSGNHGSTQLLKKKGALRWISSGILLSGNIKGIDLSLAIRRDNFSHAFDPGNRSFRSALPEYKEQWSTSIMYDGNIGNLTIWAEWVKQVLGGMACLQGLSLPLNAHWRLGMIIRYANTRYHAPFGAPFFKRNPPHNEWGAFLSAEADISNELKFRTYWNHWQFPGLRYLFDAPSSGSRWAMILEKKRRKDYTGVMQILWDHDRTRKSRFAGSNGQIFNERLRFRIHLEKILSASSVVRVRCEFAGVPQSWKRTHSRLLYAEYIFKPLQSGWKIASRISWSDIDNYDLRIAAFESDVLGRFRINSFFNSETHASLSVRYKFRWGLTLDLYTRLILPNIDTWGNAYWNHSVQFQYRLVFE